MPEPKRTDPKAPAHVMLTVTGPDGKVWGEVPATGKTFSSGSVGYYASGKLTNPDGGERYTVGANLVLIGSKP